MPEEKSKHGFILRKRPYKVPNTKNEFIIEAFTPGSEYAGDLYYIEHPTYVKIALIEVRENWRGKRCSDDMMEKLFELNKGKVFLSGQVNSASYQMFLRMQKAGLLTLSPPRPAYYEDTMWELIPGK
jgi:hypothetical protein